MGCSASRPDIFLSKAVEGCACYFFTSHSHPRGAGVTASSLAAPSPSPPVPKTRFLPAPVVHHPPTRKGDTHHLVSLISSTYGSLIIIDHRPSTSSDGDFNDRDRADQSHSPDSVINTWELMEDLNDEEDDSEFYSTKHSWSNPSRSLDAYRNPNSGMNSVSHDPVKKLSDSYVFVQTSHEITEEWNSNLENSNSKPLWKHLSEESLLLKMDPYVASTYHRTLSSRHLEISRPKMNTRSMGSSPTISRFSSITSSPLHSTSSNNQPSQIPGFEHKIVLYFTSLRGIRKTYEDCCAVRMIFRGLRVPVDERDIAMDSTYRKELKCALGGNAVSLPQVFIRGKHVGGADKIRQLNEAGELMKLIDGFPVLNDSVAVCRSCGDARFVPCRNCNGSRKVFEEEERKTKRCPDCNENGLIRCPACCS